MITRFSHLVPNDTLICTNLEMTIWYSVVYIVYGKWEIARHSGFFSIPFSLTWTCTSSDCYANRCRWPKRNYKCVYFLIRKNLLWCGVDASMHRTNGGGNTHLTLKACEKKQIDSNKLQNVYNVHKNVTCEFHHTPMRMVNIRYNLMAVAHNALVSINVHWHKIHKRMYIVYRIHCTHT